MVITTSVSVPSGLFLRDPLQTELGRNIIRYSVLLIDEIGFEAFTFKKLAKRMGSNETSLYRYFENKHLLLLYLVVWYWNWVSYLIDYNTNNIVDSKRKLDIIIDTLIEAAKENEQVEFVNERILHHIIVEESSKTYHTKAVDTENKDGFFLSYKQLTQKIADVILEIDASFPYPHSLATNLFEMANNHIFFAQHLPRLTDIVVKGEDFHEVKELLTFYVKRILYKRYD